MSKKLKYNLSIDYETLEKLLLNGEWVIGLFTPKEGVEKVELFYHDPINNFFDVGVKFFGDQLNNNSFDYWCESLNVKFIMPNKNI